MSVIEKKCKISPRIEKLKALDRRLPTTNLKKMDVVTDYNNRIAGYNGEKAMEFYLDPLAQSPKYQIFHDIRLFWGRYYFQIDFLILCSKFGLVLQVKNRARDWYFHSINQASLMNNGDKVRTDNPVLQAKLQARKLKRWLEEHHCEEMPIHYLFVNSHETSRIISEEGNDQIKDMCNSEGLLDKIEQIDNLYKEERLSKQDLRKMKRLLLAEHTPDNPDILKYFNLSPNELLPGVQCLIPKCNGTPMKYYYGVWTCPKCKEKSKTAYIQAIKDYYLLIKPSITNAEFCHFLQIKSPKTANCLLKSLNLPHMGEYKSRVYHPCLDFLHEVQ